MGQSSIIVSNCSAMHGGNITVKVQDCFLAKLVASDASDLKRLKNPDEGEKEIIDRLRKICKPNNAFYNCIDILKDNVDIISLVVNRSINKKFAISPIQKFTLNNDLECYMYLCRNEKNNDLQLVIAIPSLFYDWNYKDPEKLRQYLNYYNYPFTSWHNKDITNLVESTISALKEVVPKFMDDENNKMIINSSRTKKAIENKFMYAYCPKELLALTCEDLKLGIAPHRITKGKDGYNIAVFYPSRKKFIKWLEEKIELKDDLIQLQTNFGLNPEIFNSYEKINIDKFKRNRINSFKKYLFEK